LNQRRGGCLRWKGSLRRKAFLSAKIQAKVQEGEEAIPGGRGFSRQTVQEHLGTTREFPGETGGREMKRRRAKRGIQEGISSGSGETSAAGLPGALSLSSFPSFPSPSSFFPSPFFPSFFRSPFVPSSVPSSSCSSSSPCLLPDCFSSALLFWLLLLLLVLCSAFALALAPLLCFPWM